MGGMGHMGHGGMGHMGHGGMGSPMTMSGLMAAS